MGDFRWPGPYSLVGGLIFCVAGSLSIFSWDGQNELYAASSGRENTWMNPSTSAPTSKDTFSSLKKTENCCTCTASHSMCVPKVSKDFFRVQKRQKTGVAHIFLQRCRR